MAAPVASDPVLKWAGYAQQSGAKWGIPASVLLGLVGVESGGKEGLTSSAGAGGLTQFIPGTARSYGVNVAPGNARSQIDGAAHYLSDLGFAKNPALALAKYNAGPGNPGAGAGYARTVLARAKSYGHLNATAIPTSSSSSAGRGPAIAADPSPVDAGGVITPERRTGLLKALLSVAIVAAGAGLAWIGTHELAGARA